MHDCITCACIAVVVFFILDRFYEEFVLRSNYEECGNYLREFNLSIDKVSKWNACDSIEMNTLLNYAGQH